MSYWFEQFQLLRMGVRLLLIMTEPLIQKMEFMEAGTRWICHCKMIGFEVVLLISMGSRRKGRPIMVVILLTQTSVPGQTNYGSDSTYSDVSSLIDTVVGR
ncbi:hypothetical protein DVH24_034429 [Malus domestica]|uniref:Uncharacterized protein n=1 Tax=Malus domestica TaxID=3750 RepID=A0A498IVZ0_MALDO|nr:hypothetical protein DVH24_034429 [Malus domestica]